MPLTTKDVTTQNPASLTKNPALFSRLSEQTLQMLLQNSIEKHIAINSILIQQGDIPKFIFYILEGTLKTLRSNEDGHEATIRMLQSGETCMESVIFMGGTSPITVQSTSDSKILMIPANIIKTLALQDSQFAYNLLQIVTYHYKSAIQQIDAMSNKSPLQRVGYYFLTKHLEQGHTNLDFYLPFKKSTIANFLGMTPETFSRTLAKMKDMGIDMEEEKIQMKDAFSLCHFCDSDTQSICENHNKSNCPNCPINKH